MSSSWKGNNNRKKYKKSSPTLFQVVINQISRELKTLNPAMERISMFISLLRKPKFAGSMTVEASVLLPLLLFFFLHIMSTVEMLRLHGKLTFALWECGNQLTVYTAMPEEMGNRIADIAVSYIYVKNRLEDFLGEEYLDHSPVVSGSGGINYLASRYDGDCVDIGITYQVAPQISVFPFPYMRMVNRYYGKAWTGYENNPDVQFVYVTIYGEAWHQTLDCTHIYITIREAGWENIDLLRNANGGRYYPCELCKDKEKGKVTYYTEYGDRYHKDKECSSLVRYIRAIMKEDAISYRPCSRCVEKKVNSLE